MGYHDLAYYNVKCVKGNTDKTGFAWWYNKALENPDNPSHYPGFIPTTKMREFFGWNAEESVRMIAVFQIDGVEYEVPVTDFKALGRGDWIVNGIPEAEQAGASKVLSVVSTEYGMHQPKEVFLTNVAELVGGADNIGCESMGELKWGRRLFASISVPEHLLNDESGLQFRPILTIVTSFDRTLATKYVRTFGIPVCDNTVNYELSRAGEKDGHFVLRHSKNSANHLVDAKRVLGLLTEGADEFDKWLTEQTRIEVSEAQFVKWVQAMVPVPDIKKTIVTMKSIQGEDVQTEKVSANAQTIALKKQDRLMQMWDSDPRVKDVPASRAKIFQLWNTFIQYETSVKATRSLGGGKDASEFDKSNAKIRARIEQNMDKMINTQNQNSLLKQDMLAMDTITRIQADDDLAPVSILVGAK
jgi:hypothetical protein